MKTKIPQEVIKAYLDYDPLTGFFKWKFSRRGRAKAGTIAGTVSKEDAYVRIGLLGQVYMAHVLAWVYVTGDYPIAWIDHKDSNGQNNVFLNLRESNKSENAQNVRTAVSGSVSGFLGVSLHKKTGLWRARITINQVEKTIGYFKTPELAHSAYLAEKKILHPFGEIAK